jgi:2-polyprenyl-6-methoxyphenol hydroxylase-like FAD-dependent oxidoreductase
MPGSATRVFDRLGTAVPPAATEIVMGKAVVLGGGFAGLLAARVLADHAETVVIAEPDELSERPAFRPGVPQGNQVHVLLPGGRVQLDRFFPGFTTQACAAGALLRRRTLALPNVKVIRCRAHGIVVRGGAVAAVRCGDGSGIWDEEADFVVDAMGRSSRLSSWLEQAGWDRPPLRRTKIDIHYATALFRRSPGVPEVGAAIAWQDVSGEPPPIAVAALGAIEDDRWIVCLAGFGEHRPGRQPAEFRERCATSLPPCFAAATSGELLGGIETYAQADSRRRDFAAVRRFPAGLVAIGDAVASFNPLYGQGMSSAALHASVLSEFLRSDPDLTAPARHFFRTQKVVVDAAWQMSTSADLARPDVDGPYPRGHRFRSWLGGQVVAASMRDEEIAARFNAVTYLSRHPSLLATPGTLLRAFRVNRRR